MTIRRTNPVITWHRKSRAEGAGDYYESEPIEVVRGTGVIRLWPELTPPKKRGGKYKPVKFGKEQGYTVNFLATDEHGNHATISGPLRLADAKRAAELWLENRQFSTDDGRIVEAFEPYSTATGRVLKNPELRRLIARLTNPH